MKIRQLVESKYQTTLDALLKVKDMETHGVIRFRVDISEIGVTVLYLFELMPNHLIVFLKLIICDIEAVTDVIEKNFVLSLSLMYYSNPY